MNETNSPVTNKPRDYRGWLRGFYQDGKYEEALLLVLKEEQEVVPVPFEVLQAKASLLGLLNRNEESVVVANAAIALKSDDYTIHHIKGASLYYLQKYSEALTALDVCLALQPTFNRAVELKISSLIFLRRFKEASELYEASDLPAADGDIRLNNLGYMFLENGDSVKAGSFLYPAKALNPFLPTIYYNLSRLYWREKDYPRFVKHGIAFLFLTGLEKIGVRKYLEKAAVRREFPDGSSYFNGSGRLFRSDSQTRETQAILKLLRGFNVPALCNDTWSWFAINIPYAAVGGNSFRGDIDIILKRPRYFGTHDAGFTYRGFQVKVVSVSRFGKIRSAKRGASNLRGIKKQLDVLKAFGCEQIFLLELYVLERGYSSVNGFPSSDIANEIREKATFLQGLGYGYVVMAEEPSLTHDDEAGGVMHMPINVLHAVSNPIGIEFQTLADGIDSFLADPETQEELQKLGRREHFGAKVGYCSKCKRLTMFCPEGTNSHNCLFCKKPVY